MEQKTSLPQLIVAIVVFFVTLFGSIAIITFTYEGENPDPLIKIAILLTIGATVGGHYIGGTFFPVEQHGEIDVRKTVWGIVGTLTVATVLAIVVIVMRR